MQDDPKPTEPIRNAAPDTEILQQISDEQAAKPIISTEPIEPEAIDKPQLGPVVLGGRKSYRKQIGIVLLILVLLAIGGVLGYTYAQNKAANDTKVTTPPVTKKAASTTKTTAQGLQLDTTKNYGNKYANGLLPVGDGKYQTTGAKQGYVYTCAQYAQNLGQSQGGAGVRGPWFTNNNTQYDVNKKAHVSGSVTWQAEFSNTLSGATRTIVTNDLPNHPTGVFPIAATDAAYAYDRNPNAIKGQTLTYALPANPTYNATPNCMGGQVGVMLTGVALFNGFDAGGRDAGAWEVQDNCSGHPEKEGEYHYHTLSSCIKDISVKTVIGYALDGFPITGPTVAPNNILTTADLDECHGITSDYTVNGKTVNGYHYVMTQDFPYSASCFRANAIQPPGMQAQPAKP
ncbi:MAG TPA: YHYH protein [Candidatus Microsaccharimonas sp.]|nr:YHYH protein [Candidatus Microsaccharimonas sp.]